MNVVLLITDQHAHDALGCVGFGDLQTPTYDGLEKDGIRFTQATCATSPCLPSRHNLFNGLHAFQTGVYCNESFLRPEEIPGHSMGRLFREQGYVTGAFGKMHLFPYTAPVEPGSYYGFDCRAGHFRETGEAMDTDFVTEHRDWMEALLAERETHGIDRGGDGRAESFLGFTSKLKSTERPDWWIGEQAARFVRENRDRPFFLVCSLPMPHAPHICPADFDGRVDPGKVPLPPDPPEGFPHGRFSAIRREDLGRVVANYMSCITLADTAHGLVVGTLKECGLYEDTLILFLSDHGELLGSRGPSWMSKYSLYEQAIRIPLIVKPPRCLATGTAPSTCDTPVSLVDVLPTLADLLGWDVATRLPGIPFGSVVRGERTEGTRSTTLTELSYPVGKVSLALRSSSWKWILGADGHEEVYDLTKDPYEFHDLANTERGKAIASEMKNELVNEIRRCGDRRTSERFNYPDQGFSLLPEEET